MPTAAWRTAARFTTLTHSPDDDERCEILFFSDSGPGSTGSFVAGQRDGPRPTGSGDDYPDTGGARRQILIDALQRWGIQDAAHRLATDLARYAIEAILRAIAAFQAKLDMGALHGIEQLASYFAAMVRNQNQAIEIEATAHQLLELRLRHRDLCLAPLQELVEKITRSLTPNQLPGRLVELALEAERLIDFRFYAAQAGRALEALDPEAAQTLFPFLARKVAWSFRTDKQRRDDLVAILSAAVAYRPQ